MDPLKNNHIPENVHSIHLIAVCGTGMGALAAMLKELGYKVTGSDQHVYPPMSDFLAARGIAVAEGFRAENIAGTPDLVVIGNAVSRTNPEVEAVLAAGLPYCSMPQALNHFVAAEKRPVVITGTHGKTTTAALTAWLLHDCGLDPSFMIGGILQNFISNYRLGAGAHLVLEGDEYDTAFFDKGPKFLHYVPRLAVLTSVEFDHADIFRDLEHIKAAFTELVSRMPGESVLLAYDADVNIRAVLPAAGCRVETYGRRPDSTWRLDSIRVLPTGTEAVVFRENKRLGVLKSPMLGEHNLCNALAATAVCLHCGSGFDRVAASLQKFTGIRRRQEIRGRKRGITVLDDFAHHPTAVRETLRAVRASAGNGRLVAVFEPRTNTSMRDVFQQDYVGAFDAADLICVRHPPLLHKIPEGRRFSSEALVESLVGHGKEAHFFPDTEAILEFLAGECRSGDVVLIMSNGGFDNIHQRLLDAL
jgi:UDP-N-acetylmuramate: L-alanyl-gamma-D-glutamyl-meso-diaminopimelate ligase